MTMPKKNIMFNEVQENTPVTLEGGTNKYYVAVINGERGLVIMDGQYQREQQKRLDELCRHTKMREKGYLYVLRPVSKRFEPLYSKTTDDTARVMREYRKERFNVTSIV